MSKTIEASDVREWDRIIITGTASSPHKQFVGFECVVATVAADGSIKVWPAADADVPLTFGELRVGKIWFDASQIEAIELVDRE